MASERSAADANAFIAGAPFHWHQRFELADGVFTPGIHDIGLMLAAADVSEVLGGASVLDIGASNGGLAFELERAGAERVVAVDLYAEDWFGFAQVKEFLGSQAEYLRASVYELPSRLDEQFDVVAFCGVLYHLRHPLLALDAVRALTRGRALIESAIRDRFLGDSASLPLIHFHRLDDLAGDASNWFEPSATALSDWCRSCGLEPTKVRTWPPHAPGRCMVTAVPTSGDPEYMGMSYELPLSCTIQPGRPMPGDNLRPRAHDESPIPAQRDGRGTVQTDGRPTHSEPPTAELILSSEVGRTLPVPPPEMRALVGPTDVADFDYPAGGCVFPISMLGSTARYSTSAADVVASLAS